MSFDDYDSEYLIFMNSTSCGHLDFQNNTIENVPGAAVYAVNLTSYIFAENLFLNSGSREDDINPMVYLEGCLDKIGKDWYVNSTGPMIFDQNKTFCSMVDRNQTQYYWFAFNSEMG